MPWPGAGASGAPARVQDRDGAVPLFKGSRTSFPFVKLAGLPSKRLRGKTGAGRDRDRHRGGQETRPGQAASVPIFFRFRSHFGAPAWNTSAAPPRAARCKGARAQRAARQRSDGLFRRPVRGRSDARYSRSCPNLTSFASSLRLMFNPRGTRRSAQTMSAPQPCIRLDLADPGHEAVIRFSDRVPRRRAHSWRRREGRGASRVAATSDCSRRRSPNCRSTPKLEGVHMVMTLVILLGEALRLAEPRPYEQDAIGR